jgi:heptose III glucuronosyltransferase
MVNSSRQALASLRLSVIIPVHNAAPWLAQCLDSLLAQRRAVDEIIAVDDASTDESPAILAEYARCHPQFRLLQSGGCGASVARNTGLDAASGDWIGFVDADDWLEPDAYAQMLALGEAETLDMVLINGRYDYAGCPPDHRIYSDPPLSGVRSGGDWLAYKLENRSMLHMVWLHLYRREFIERHHLRFVPGITFEDVIWSTRALVLATRVDYIDTPFFYYRKLPRRLEPVANDRKMLHIIASSKVNARTLAEIASNVSDPRLAGLIRWQLVDGGFAIFHRANQIVDRKVRNEAWWLALTDGTISLLWRHAGNLRQRKKLVARALRAVLLKCLP